MNGANVTALVTRAGGSARRAQAAASDVRASATTTRTLGMEAW
jgi:hypothetical protein